jgi:ubiquinone/menaquinone biosynthesis C-methylase UbiE
MKVINLGCGNEIVGDVRVDRQKTETTTHVLDLNQLLPFNDNEFDMVYCRSTLEHVGNVKQFIDEAKRILKENGVYWFRTDNASYLPFHLRSHQDYLAFEDWTDSDKHYYLFKTEHLKNLFGENIEIRYTCPSKKLFFLPKKYKCMHIEVGGVK